VYAFGIAKNHAFIDGNKRTAYLAAIVFLEVNGYPLELSGAEWVVVMNDVASGKMSRDELATRLSSALPGGGPVYVDV
jgi:death on curing protein